MGINVRITDTNTGEFDERDYSDNHIVEVKPERTPEQIARGKQKTEMDIFLELNGGFCFMSYELFREVGLEQANISRVIYLATYLEMNTNKIVKPVWNRKNGPMTRNEIKKVMMLSDRAFEDFWKDLNLTGLLVKYGDGSFGLNEKYFKRGKVKKDSNYKKGEYTRILKDTIRELYTGTTPRQHKTLSQIFQLLPLMNYENNSICNEDGSKMTIEQIAQFLEVGMSRKNVYNLRNSLVKFRVRGIGLLCEVVCHSANGKTSRFVVNPNVVYGGNDHEEVKKVLSSLLDI